ncbi:MAG TPA: acetylglutamate kinase [Opitutales bacterium]|nr:acetylglutamate kinase [Opitutales bacterium]
MFDLTKVSDEEKFGELIVKAQVLLEALPYIQTFRGSTFVVKYGGSFMDDPDPEVRARVAIDLVFLAAVGIHVVVVHGGGKAISRSMEAAGLQPVFADGLRVTDEKTMEVVKRTLNEEVNARICEMILENRGQPVGMHGETILACSKLQKDEEGNQIDLGLVGEVTEVKVKLIKKALSEGGTPIISPVAEGADGKCYNVNADLAAARVAGALRARRLVFMSDVPGLLRDPEDPETLIPTVKIGDVDELKRTKVIGKGMLPKMNGAIRALQEGVHRVHFIDGRMPHSLLLEIFTDKGVGTEIVH